MQPAAPEISICPRCGAALEEGLSDGIACIGCLLQVGIGGEADWPQDVASPAFEDDGYFGVYEIERGENGSFCELGHGAMGVTYRAIDRTLERKVALKIIRTGMGMRSADGRRRFLSEARAAAALRHENIAMVFQFGIREETGQCFYAMELIEGETLEERVLRADPLDARATIDIAQQVISALAAAEKRCLIHRDLKPANLMLVSPDDETTSRSTDRADYSKPRGVVAMALQRCARRNAIDRTDARPLVKIIDFGLVKALDTRAEPIRLICNSFVGTPAFASPEQFTNSALDTRSDVYSLGATLWFALTGNAPFSGDSVDEIRRAQQSNELRVEQLKAAAVPACLRSVIKSMLAFEPAMRPHRYDLAQQFQRCAAQLA